MGLEDIYGRIGSNYLGIWLVIIKFYYMDIVSDFFFLIGRF